MAVTLSSPSSVNAAWVRALTRTARLGERPTFTLAALVDEAASQHPDAPALLSASESFSYGALAARARHYASWARSQNIGRGNVVGLLMANRPEYVAIWLGITRTGATVALLNTNLTGAALGHCLSAAKVSAVIVEAPLAGQLYRVAARLTEPVACWLHGEAAFHWPRIDQWSANDAGAAISCDVTLADRALYIYTSGTTGLPKAASISHHRIMQWSQWFAGIADLRASDRTYNCLPLYHSVGGVVAVGAALSAGGSVFLRDKFSGSAFWPEVEDWDCTVFQYIGELCRYLLSAPSSPADQRHRLRLACGNGLRADVWEAFQSRFAVPQILEFYAATEGNFSLFNCEGRPGAIGRFPNFLPQRKGVALIKVDPATGTAIRNLAGHCEPCGPDEAGEAISLIAPDGMEAPSRFEGYADAGATERKILRDVFLPGDAWFRSGDLMRKDAKGYFYFADRIGETFRWKGENVSAAEVTAAVRACPGVRDADVYGVRVPGAEGRAGMVAIIAGPSFDLGELHNHMTAQLPAYARPLFVRICNDLARTATFKANTQQLQTDGFDPAIIADPLYIEAPGTGGFEPLDPELYKKLTEGKLRL